MSFPRPLNNVAGSLSARHNAGSGTLVLQAGEGALFGSTFPIRVTVSRRNTLSNGRIVRTTSRTIFEVAGRTGDTLTGLTVPADEDTAAWVNADRDYATADPVSVEITAATITQLQDIVVDVPSADTVVLLTGDQTRTGSLTQAAATAASTPHVVKGAPLVAATITAVEVASTFVYAHVSTTAGAIVGREAVISGLTANSWLNGVFSIDEVLASPARIRLGNVVHAEQAPLADSGTLTYNPQSANPSEHRDGAGTVLAEHRPEGTLVLRQPTYTASPGLDIRRTRIAAGGMALRVQSPIDSQGDNGTWTTYIDDGGGVRCVVNVIASGKKTGTGIGYLIHGPTEGMPTVLEGNLQAYSDCATAIVARDGCTGLGAGTSLIFLGINDIANAFSCSIAPDGTYGWMATQAVGGGGIPVPDTTLKRAGAGVAEFNGHLALRGTSAVLDLINDTSQWSLNYQTATTALEVQVGGVSVTAIRGVSGSMGQWDLVAPPAQAPGCGFNLFSGSGKVGGITQNSGGSILILPDFSGGLVYLGFSFATYADNTGNFKVGGNLQVGGGSLLLKKVSATATLDFPSVAAGGQQELTITVTGAAVGGSVSLGPPATLTAGLIATGRVTAADTVTVRMSNITAAPIDPASATWRATVENF